MISPVADAPIAHCDTPKEEHYLELEVAAQAFIRATQTFAEGELRQKAEQAVTAQHTLTRRLGERGLRPLKRELDELIASKLHEVVLGQLNQHGLWPHRGYNGHHPSIAFVPFRTSTVSPLPLELSHAIGEVLKHTLAPLLKKHGYTFVPFGKVQSEEMMAAFRRYSDLYFGGAEAYGNLKPAEVDAGPAEAKRLWDAV